MSSPIWEMSRANITRRHSRRDSRRQTSQRQGRRIRKNGAADVPETMTRSRRKARRRRKIAVARVVRPHQIRATATRPRSNVCQPPTRASRRRRESSVLTSSTAGTRADVSPLGLARALLSCAVPPDPPARGLVRRLAPQIHMTCLIYGHKLVRRHGPVL